MLRWLLVLIAAFAIFRWTQNLAPDRSVLPPLTLHYAPGAIPYAPGSPALIEFWATWCPPCRETVPHLNQLLEDGTPLGLQIVAVTSEDLATIESFRNAHDVRYSVAMDAPGLWSRHFDVPEIPHAVLVDGEGKVCWTGDPRELTVSKLLDLLP